MKKFKVYLRKKNVDMERLAVDLNVSIATVYGWANGKAKPGVGNAIALEKYTKGAVTVYDWA